MSIVPGDYLDRFKLVAQAGEGGQGAVWKALDERNGNREIAIKIHHLHTDLGTTGQSTATHLARLRREAEALRQLSHPSLVRCLGMFEDYEHEILGIVLEWIDGQTLAGANKNPAMTPTHRMWLLGHLVRALAYLHSTGIVHRDLKFGNVLVNRQFWDTPSSPETIKLVDLGVAAPVGNPNPLTMMGTFVGTSAYVAPEIVTRGQNPHLSASPASDVFAFGVLGWRLLTGEHPTGLPLNADFLRFVTFYQAVQAGMQPWPASGKVEGPWGEVLLRCIQIDAAQRPQTAAAVVDYLEGRTPVPSRNQSSIPPAHEPEEEDGEEPTLFYDPYGNKRPPSLRKPSSVPNSSHQPVPPPSGLAPSGVAPTTAMPATTSQLVDRPSVPSLAASAAQAQAALAGSPLAPLPATGATSRPMTPLASSSTSTGPYQPLPPATATPVPIENPPTIVDAPSGRGSRVLVFICVVAALVIVAGIGFLLTRKPPASEPAPAPVRVG